MVDYLDLEITVKTPKGKATATEKNNRKALLGYKKASNIKHTEIINDHTFKWIIGLKDEKECDFMMKRLALGENMIKGFYRQLYKFIRLTNRSIKLANKLGKAGHKALEWLKRRMEKILRSQIPDEESRNKILGELKEEIDKTEITDGLIQPIKIDDQEEMDKLLSGSLIDIKTIATDSWKK